MERIVIDVITGERRIVSLTAAEIAEIESRPKPTPPPPMTAAERLEAAGFSIDELRALLLDKD